MFVWEPVVGNLKYIHAESFHYIKPDVKTSALQVIQELIWYVAIFTVYMKKIEVNKQVMIYYYL